VIGLSFCQVAQATFCAKGCSYVQAGRAAASTTKGGAMRWRRSLWVILLGVYLILVGLQQAFGVNFQYMDLIMGILAIAAGVLILIQR
jgi:hypothetical protein